MTSVPLARRRQQAKAARQALTLCEAEQGIRSRTNPIAARTALRAAGLPPLLAAALRNQLHLIAEQEATR
jgi:hypothetical protein